MVTENEEVTTPIPEESEPAPLPEETADPEATPESDAGAEEVTVEELMQRIAEMEQAQAAAERPLLTTRFEDYTVTEGLLLLLLLSVFVSACVRMLKGGFAWLR